MENDNRELPWTIAETCAYLKISRRTLYRYMDNGLIIPKKFGHCVRFNPEKVRQFFYNAADWQPANAR